MDVVSREVDEIPVFDFSLVETDVFEKLENKLITSYTTNQTTRSRRGDLISTDEINFNVKECKPILDEIDAQLARHYGFTEEELDFILNYDIKYRLGRGGGEEEE
jgi:hypothetical protein